MGMKTLSPGDTEGFLQLRTGGESWGGMRMLSAEECAASSLGLELPDSPQLWKVGFSFCLSAQVLPPQPPPANLEQTWATHYQILPGIFFWALMTTHS